MKTYSVRKFVLLLVLGGLLLTAGVFALTDAPKQVVGLCFGGGAGLIGMTLANGLIARYYYKHPQYKKQSNIDAKDERSVAITHRAKAKAFDLTILLMMLYPFVLILTDAPLWMIFIPIAIYLIGFFFQIGYTIKYGKEM